MSIVENFDLYTPRLINKKELLSAGHRACSGCAEVSGRTDDVQSAW